MLPATPGTSAAIGPACPGRAIQLIPSRTKHSVLFNISRKYLVILLDGASPLLQFIQFIRQR